MKYRFNLTPYQMKCLRHALAKAGDEYIDRIIELQATVQDLSQRLAEANSELAELDQQHGKPIQGASRFSESHPH